MTRGINAKRFSRIMREMAKVPKAASADIAKDISAEIQRNFDRGVDPYGRPWRKLAKSTLKRGRTPPPLSDTRKGRKSVQVSALTSGGIRIVVGVLYMIYHQFGGKSHLRGHRKNKHFGRDRDRSPGRERPPKRSFLPFDRMPARWDDIVRKRVEERVRKMLSRG